MEPFVTPLVKQIGHYKIGHYWLIKLYLIKYIYDLKLNNTSICT